MKQHYTIAESDGVVRVDKFLAAKYPEYSRAAIAKLFTLNLIKLRGESIQPGHKLRPGTMFEYDLGPLSEKPEVIELPVLYEDENVIVIDKPAGIISHARGKFWQEASVASFIRNKVSTENNENSTHRAGIVHRLDRATSGVMICAKNEATLGFLQKQFSARSVHKTYVAIVSPKPKDEEAIIDAPIGRHAEAPSKFHVHPEGKSAQTHYKVLQTGKNWSMLELHPKTGRTHQLRVHLNYIHTPIVGDTLYGGEAYERLLLHASTLEIELPNLGRKAFTSTLPDAFQTHMDHNKVTV